MNQALPFLYTLLASIGGGIVQATTGFGFGIFVMIFFPLYLPILQASALSSAISFFLITSLLWHYRKSVQWNRSLFPAVIYLTVSTVIILALPQADMGGLQIAFAVFMLVLACYLGLFSERVHVRATPLTAGVCAALSGAAGGLFGLGGPPMTVYFLALYGDEKQTYMGALQFFFWVTNLVNNGVRFATGILTAEVLWLLIPGILGQAIGARVGTHIVDRIPVSQFRKVVYGFLAISGLITLITCLA